MGQKADWSLQKSLTRLFCGLIQMKPSDLHLFSKPPQHISGIFYSSSRESDYQMNQMEFIHLNWHFVHLSIADLIITFLLA